jgi:hypothetical protein
MQDALQSERRITQPKIRQLEAANYSVSEDEDSLDDQEYSDGEEGNEESKKELQRLQKWNMELDNYQEGDLQIEDILEVGDIGEEAGDNLVCRLNTPRLTLDQLSKLNQQN